MAVHSPKAFPVSQEAPIPVPLPVVVAAVAEGVIDSSTWKTVYARLATEPDLFVSRGHLVRMSQEAPHEIRRLTATEIETRLADTFAPQVAIDKRAADGVERKLVVLEVALKEAGLQLEAAKRDGGDLAVARAEKRIAVARSEALRLFDIRDGALTGTAAWSKELLGALRRGLMSEAAHEPIRKLTKVTHAPYFDERGRLHATTGYDATTGVLLVASPLLDALTSKALERRLQRFGTWHAVAKNSAGILLRTIETMPGTSTSPNRAGWLCLVCTPILRSCFPTSPVFMVTANRARTGKTICTHSANYISQAGYPTSMILFDRSLDSELDKLVRQRFLTADAPGVVFIDNFRQDHFGSPLIEAAVTARGSFDVRPLGRSDSTKKIPNGWTFVLSANNPSYKPDTLRRCLVVDFEYPGEDPGSQTFDRVGPLDWAERFQTKLTKHALILALAHRNAGYPQPTMGSFNSFEGWQYFVQAAVQWATGIDPREGVRDLMAEEDEDDSMVARWAAALVAVGATSASSAIKVADLLTKPATAVRAAIETAPKRADGRVNDIALGLILKNVTRRTVGGQRICRRVERGFKKLWVETKAAP